MKQQSPMLRLWELGEGQQGGLKRAVLSAVVGVLFGMLPYFAVAQIILGLLSGNQESSFYLTWCAVALVGFLLRATLYSLALSQSHKATFAILKSIREKVLEKLPKMPLGTILDTSTKRCKSEHLVFRKTLFRVCDDNRGSLTCVRLPLFPLK